MNPEEIIIQIRNTLQFALANGKFPDEKWEMFYHDVIKSIEGLDELLKLDLRNSISTKQTAEDFFNQYNNWQPKDKLDKSMRIFDWYDMIDFATQYDEQKKQSDFLNKLDKKITELLKKETDKDIGYTTFCGGKISTNGYCDQCGRKAERTTTICSRLVTLQTKPMSDEEIDKAFPITQGIYDSNMMGKRYGAKWMRDKINQPNKK